MSQGQTQKVTRAVRGSSDGKTRVQLPKGELVVLRDDRRIARNRKLSQYLSLGGFLLLISGMLLGLFASDLANVLLYQTLALLGGWALSQVGLFLAHRYSRSPRPDEVLDDALRKVARDGRLYHYLLPAPHVLLTPAGPIVLVAKYQAGSISYENGRWRQTGVGLRRFFGQEGVGNPLRDAESMVKALAGYISKHAPGVSEQEIPIGAVIVFTAKDLKNLNVSDSPIPAMHASKLRGFLKQKGQAPAMPREQYEAMRTAFDRPAAHLIAD